METDTSAKLEALLFALGRPVSRAELRKHLEVDEAALTSAIAQLADNARGVTVVDDGTELELRVGPGAAELIAKVRKEEMGQSIGKAGLEALAAVLYRGPLTRSELDFIRGVNSAQTLRTLSTRGLLRRIPNPKMERSYLYEPTTELLATLGVTSVKELPEYSDVRHKLSQLEAAYRAKEEHPEEAL